MSYSKTQETVFNLVSHRGIFKVYKHVIWLNNLITKVRLFIELRDQGIKTARTVRVTPAHQGPLLGLVQEDPYWAWQGSGMGSTVARAHLWSWLGASSFSCLLHLAPFLSLHIIFSFIVPIWHLSMLVLIVRSTKIKREEVKESQKKLAQKQRIKKKKNRDLSSRCYEHACGRSTCEYK